MNSLLKRIKNFVWKVVYENRTHIFLWVIYALYESVIIGFITGTFGALRNYIIHYTLNISLFYFHSWIMGRVRIKISSVYYALILTIVLFEMCSYVLSIATLNHFFTIYNQPNSSNSLGIDRNFTLRAIYRSLFFIILGTGYWYLKQYFRERQKNQALEQQRLQNLFENEKINKALVQAENAYMRAQINPHFLFNTLAFVHTRVRATDQVAGEIVLSLAKLMRYAVDLNQQKIFSPLSDEIEQIENLINLLQLKENHTLSIHFDFEDQTLKCKIIPLALLTLCENVFKHGVLDDESFPARISIKLINNRLCIQTHNKINLTPKTISSRTGINNLKERLFQHYGEDFIFKISGTNIVFNTKLEIPSDGLMDN